MPAALQIRRGLKNALPAKAALGEPLISTDTRELFIGQGIGVSDGGVYKVSDVIFATSPPDPTVEKEKIWINITDDTMHRASDDGLSWLPIGGNASVGSLSADLTVYGVSQGSYSNGNVIAAGTSLETIVKNMLQTIIPPTYQAPTLSIAGSGLTSVEAGTTIAPIITPTFTQRDGGTGILYNLNKNGSSVVSNAGAISYNDPGQVLGDASISFQASETYNQGPIKNDNQSNPYPTGRINAGTAVSGTVTYTGKRNLFYGADIGLVAPTDSAGIRILANKVLGAANGAGFTINIPAGTARVVIAYPDTLRDITSIKYVELGNGEVKDTFVKTQFVVEGAAGFTAVGYKIFSYVPAVPYGDAVTYTVTI